MTSADSLQALSAPLYLLLARYHQLLKHGQWRPEKAAELRQAASSLALGLALIERQKLTLDLPQVVVIGPTQVGKSTLSNALLGEPLAGVSPLAGYTAHAQGFIAADDQAMSRFEAAVSPFFRDYQRVSAETIQRSDSQSYCLKQASQAVGQSLSMPCVLWDSPDFDSVSAVNYWHSVIRLRALADVLVLAVSKDKYADQSVWDMLALSRSLGTPTVVIINKLDPASQAPILEAFQARWAERVGGEPAALLAVPYTQGDETLPNDSVQSVRRAVDRAIEQSVKLAAKKAAKKTSTAPAHQAGLQPRFFAQHRRSWLAPVEQEVQAHQQWLRLREQTAAKVLRDYQQGYQAQGEHYPALQQAIAKLLELLELPFIGSAMSNARHVLTWPVKRALKWRREQTQAEAPPSAQSAEREFLLSLITHGTEHLQRQSFQHSANDEALHDWWQTVATRLEAQKSEVNTRCETAADQHIEQFSNEIDAAAHRLYDRLQTQPALLNSLRAARATTDAAAVVLTVKSGGLGLADLILAPAMLSFTSMLTEGALGTYMKTVENDLRHAQLKSVRKHMLNAALLPAWEQALPDSHDAKSGVFGFDQRWLDSTKALLDKSGASE